MHFVCPQCRGELRGNSSSYCCEACQRTYPVIGGIPDFRLKPDPYIGLDDDRAKGLMLMEEGRTRGFEGLLRHYYAITPEDPPDLAVRWIARALGEVEIARLTLATYGLENRTGPLLDLGCSTGALLAAAAAPNRPITGVDVAFRWLAVGSVRLRELGIAGSLVCANAEHLPFPENSFATVTAIDLIEHTREPLLAVSEARRVSAAGAHVLWITNNRYAPIPDPQVHLWGVGLLPRRWQVPYVARRRRDLHVYRVSMVSARELNALFLEAGYQAVGVSPAVLFAPHIRSPAIAFALRVHNRVSNLRGIRGLLKLVGPKLAARAVR